jgi:hypothetical protein
MEPNYALADTLFGIFGMKRVMNTVTFTFPMKLASLANVREHWRVKHRRSKEQRALLHGMLWTASKPLLPATVTITRIGKKKLDSDNLAISAKHVRDGIADAYGVDDGSDLYTWKYEQEIGKEYAVRIEIRPRI